MKHRVNIFAKRIGSRVGKPIDVDKQTLIQELSPFVLPRTDGKAGLLVEEVEELTEAIKEGNIVGTLDAVVDIAYFLDQMILWLEKAGIDYQLACEKVCDNNDEKVTSSLTFIENKLLEWKENDPWFASKLHINESFVDGESWYCLHDDNGKVRKFVDFEQVDLIECIPKELLEG
jgi:hypothetical protein